MAAAAHFKCALQLHSNAAFEIKTRQANSGQLQHKRDTMPSADVTQQMIEEGIAPVVTKVKELEYELHNLAFDNHISLMQFKQHESSRKRPDKQSKAIDHIADVVDFAAVVVIHTI